MTYMEFSKRLRYCIHAKGITIKDFARRARVSQSTAYEWFEGNSYPTMMSLLKIVDVLGTHPSYLLGYNDNPVKPKRRSKDAE